MFEPYDMKKELMGGRRVGRKHYDMPSIFGLGFALLVLVQIALVIATIWVAVHFIRKYW